MADESRTDLTPDPTERADDLSEVEAALFGLAPRSARLSAARLMYLAGQESAAQRGGRLANWLWPSLATVSTLAASVMAALLVLQSGPTIVERIVYVERPAADRAANKLVESVAPSPADAPRDATFPAPVAHLPTPSYLQARNLAMSQGVDSLPAHQSNSSGVEIRPVTYRELQNRALEGEPGGRRKLPDAGFYSWPNLLLPGR